MLVRKMPVRALSNPASPGFCRPEALERVLTLIDDQQRKNMASTMAGTPQALMRLIPVRATYVTHFRSCRFLAGCYI